MGSFAPVPGAAPQHELADPPQVATPPAITRWAAFPYVARTVSLSSVAPDIVSSNQKSLMNET
jgi:hypothetical protein